MIKPATPLPWTVGIDRPAPTKMYALIEAADHSYPARADGPEASQDARYIAHAANAYPKLVEALREHAFPETQRGQHALSLLHELGEDK
jgi:hypothetical protein